VQRAVREAFEEMCGAPSPGWGIDGCAAPNFACTLRGLAWAMARMADPRGLGPAREAAARRLVEGMLAHPLLLSGEGRACAELMTAMGGRVVVKTGAEAVYTAILPERRLGVALKIEDGATRASESAITAILARLGAIDARDPAAARRLDPPVLSRLGAVAGAIRPDPSFWAGGAPLQTCGRPSTRRAWPRPTRRGRPTSATTISAGSPAPGGRRRGRSASTGCCASWRRATATWAWPGAGAAARTQGCRWPDSGVSPGG
jgi:hypothetical protein